MNASGHRRRWLILAALSVLAVSLFGLSTARQTDLIGHAMAAWSGTSPKGVDTGAGRTASTEAKEPFFCYVETLTADRPSVYGYLAARGCVPTGEYRQGERTVWRFIILDTETGQQLTLNEAASVRLKLPYGYLIDAEWKQRGEGRVPDAPWTWDVCWDVPLDFPLGVLDYSIEITRKDGRTGSWKPPAFIDPGRSIDTRPRIIGANSA